MNLTLFLETATGRLWAKRFQDVTPEFSAKRGDVLNVDVQCVGRGDALTADSAVAFVLKRPGFYDSDPVLAVSDFAWSTDKWVGTLTLLNDALDALLSVDNVLTNDIANVTFMGEVAHKADVDDDVWIRSQQITFAVENNVFRPEDELEMASSLPDLFARLQGVLVAGAGITLTEDTEARTITISLT
jgi:hypothetical protein